MNISRTTLIVGLLLAFLVALVIFGRGGETSMTLTESDTTSVRSPAVPTIDTDPLVTHLSRPELSGTTPNEGSFTIGIYDPVSGQQKTGGALTNETWTFKPCFPLQAGAYLVQISDDSLAQTNERTGKILNPDTSIFASAMLTIKEPVTPEGSCSHDAI